MNEPDFLTYLAALLPHWLDELLLTASGLLAWATFCYYSSKTPESIPGMEDAFWYVQKAFIWLTIAFLMLITGLSLAFNN